MNDSLKDILSVNCLPDLFSRWRYISLDQIKVWLNKHQVIYSSSTVTKYLSKLKQKKQIWDAGKGWYSTIEISFELDRTPVKKVVELLCSEFPNLELSCWSTEQINRYLNHLQSSFITFVHVKQGFEDEITRFLDARGWRVFRRHVGSRIEQYYPQTQTLLVQTLVSRAPSADGYASIEKILVDLYKENILPKSEVKHAIGVITDNQRIQIGTLLSYAIRRDIEPEDILLGSKSINSTFLEKVELADYRNRAKRKTIHKQENALFKNLLKRPHLQSTFKEMGNVSKQTLERSVRALALVTRLAESGLPFVFKGGTSLLLRLKKINRLSIDVDITCHLSHSELLPYFDKVLKTDEFSQYQLMKRMEEDLLPLSSFTFEYRSAWDDKQDFIRVDVLHEQRLFQYAKKILVVTPFFRPHNPSSVIVPTQAELLADKLTAFAPHTLGPLIEDDPPEVMQIAKHLFDVGELFNEADKLSVVRETYTNLVEKENKYLGSEYNTEEALRDVYESALSISKVNLPKVNQTDEMELYRQGFEELRSHVIPEFLQSDYKLAASKAALCAILLLCKPQASSLRTYRRPNKNTTKIKENILRNELEPLNALFKTAPLAYTYWVEIQKIIQKK